MTSYVKFPAKHGQITAITDENWGPQDQTTTTCQLIRKRKELDPFATHSFSGFIIYINSPVHWSARRQKVTAHSSAEAEIYATDECVKFLNL